jgi:DNA-binding NtrC family response regulator
VLRLAPLEVPVLITGETGTGKELVARAIHESGPHSREPFIAVNCGAIAETLLESELFGHERGAFTGAVKAHRGLFEEAGQGAVLLDEIGEITPRLQVALLRVLETGEVRPVGSATQRRTRCRILAATNADLEALAGKGLFRKDLLFRLRRMELHLLPLRERREDILPLAGHFLAEGRVAGQRPEMTPELRDALLKRDWPGNVRELRSLVETMRLLNSDALRYGLEALETAGPKARPRRTVPDGISDPPQASSAVESPARAQQSSGAEPANLPKELSSIMQEGRTALRRLERIRAIFRQCRTLTRSEVVKALNISPTTATADLKTLCREGLIRRVEPSASTRSYYFALLEGPAGNRQG